MSILIQNVVVNNKVVDVVIENGKLSAIMAKGQAKANYDQIIQARGLTMLPAFVDMHTHLREPGFEYKEDIESGCKAAVAGGYASVCCMPNTKPVIDNSYIVKYIINRAKEVNLAKVYPIGAISVGLIGDNLSEIGKLKQAGAIAVSDDGQPVTSAQLMRLALEYSKDHDILVISHCEDKSLVDSGVVNEGYYATKIGLRGIPSAAEDIMISREMILAEMLDTKVHIAHVSTKTGVQLIREAKARGVKVSAETCPHYVVGTDALVDGYDTRAKVNPPMRANEDKQAIIQGLLDGTIDCIATDHAPHSAEEKSLDMMSSPFGISGIETAFGLCYTALVDSGLMSLQELSNKMTANPAKILGIPYGQLVEGATADFVLVDLSGEYNIDSTKFLSKGKNTPFDGWKIKGKVHYTIVDGQIKYQTTEKL